MANPEVKGKSLTGKIVAIKPGYELARDYPNLIAIIKARQQVMGDRRTRNIWYPLITEDGKKLEVGQRVLMTRRTEKVGKGSRTTSTIRPV